MPVNSTTIFLLTKVYFLVWALPLAVVIGIGGPGLGVKAQVFSRGQLIPTLINIPDYTSPNQLIPPLIPQLIPTLPGDTTCSPFQKNLSQCLKQYRNTTIPTPVLRSILPRTPETSSSAPAATASTPAAVPTSPTPLPAPGTVTESNCPQHTDLILLPGGYACMQRSHN